MATSKSTSTSADTKSGYSNSSPAQPGEQTTGKPAIPGVVPQVTDQGGTLDQVTSDTRR